MAMRLGFLIFSKRIAGRGAAPLAAHIINMNIHLGVKSQLLLHLEDIQELSIHVYYSETVDYR